MNRKLQINIEQIEQDNQQDQEMEEEDYQSEVAEREQEYQSNQNNQDDDKSAQLKVNSRKNRFQINQNVQTLGQDKNHSSLLRQFVNSTQQKHRHTEQLSKLLETPVRSYDKQEQKNHKNRLQQSSVDEEINRIVNKVMGKKATKTASNIPKQLYQLQQVNKIDAINKELLRENTKLVSQINQLQKQLYALNRKLPTKRRIKQNNNKTISSCQDMNFADTITKYKERLAKAMNLNNKLSSRLNTQKSRSRVISSCYPSKVTKKDNISSQIQLTSLDSNLLRISKKQREKKQSNVSQNMGKGDHVYCQKCFNEIKANVKDSPQWNGSKQYKQSPVLQFKNYKIECWKTLNCNQFQLGQTQHSKRYWKDVQCQVSLDQTQYLQQLQAYTRQQTDLQRLIKDNNKKIIYLQESLYRLVDYQ